MRALTGFIAALLLTAAHPPAAAAPKAPTAELSVRATLVQLPAAPACDQKIHRVTALYRVEEVLRGDHDRPAILVVHRCPELPRGPSRHGRGDAHRMRPGHRHILRLEPLPDGPERIDPFGVDAGPRFQPIETNMAPEPPRIVVVVQGGAGASYKLRFDADSLVVGRAVDADVRLADRSVGERHLALRVRGERVEITPVNDRPVLLDGKPLRAPTRITYQDRIGVGTYTIRIALFLDSEE